ncbi:polysaccharide deacetylase family protein [Howardella ureilytica]|nr:polysaccharide deacetylase [Lachnospiraceae bacterium]MDY2956586.1 polysaccharide deacetylase family protein [Lachnospiraceae bacterium]
MKYSLKKKRSKMIYILPISIIAGCIIVSLVVMNAFGFGKSGSDQHTADSNSVTTESGSDNVTTTEQETETTAPQSEHTNPKDAKAAEELEKSSENRVYLTFDDGPSSNTDEILDILKKNNIKATFFVIKRDDPESVARLKRIYDEGHTVALHTVSHDYPLVYADMDSYKKDVDGIKSFVDSTLGINCKFYRFPGGSSNTIYKHYGIKDIHECIDYLNSIGVEYFDWNISNSDSEGKKYTPEQLAENVETYIGDTGVYNILQHDAPAKKNTVKSLQLIIDNLKAKGYTFCQITDNTKPVHHHIS